MANNLTNLEEIVTEMQSVWINNPCIDGGQNGFYFGWPQEVDDIHSKQLPLMIVNPPSATILNTDFEREYGIVSNRYTIQVYQFLPSANNLKSSVSITSLWDAIEDCFYNWLQLVLNNLGPNKVLLGSGQIEIIRNKEASNDRLFMSQFEFNLKTYRKCLTLQ